MVDEPREKRRTERRGEHADLRVLELAAVEGERRNQDRHGEADPRDRAGAGDGRPPDRRPQLAARQLRDEPRAADDAAGLAEHVAEFVGWKPLIPQVLYSHPLLGLGLNNFSVYYQFVTGKTNWGPHSFYVALIVETGLIGFLVFMVFLRYLFVRLHAARALGRMLDAARDPLGRRVRPLAWGFTAALAGTMAANLFYLTMQFS